MNDEQPTYRVAKIDRTVSDKGHYLVLRVDVLGAPERSSLSDLDAPSRHLKALIEGDGANAPQPEVRTGPCFASRKPGGGGCVYRARQTPQGGDDE
jgi:hypothetical protein